MDRFWAVVGRRRSDGDLAALADSLAALPPEEIERFAVDLATALHALDTPGHYQAAGSPGSDWFLYVRCAVVAAGRSAYERVLGDPSRIRRFANRDAEPLLTVAPEAYERSTGMPWELETPVSYETGSNAAWGAERLPDVAEPRWLDLMLGSAAGPGMPPHFDYLLIRVCEAVATDPAWERWWAAGGVPRLELQVFLDGAGEEAPRTVVRRGRTKVVGDFCRYPELSAGDDLLASAVDEARAMLAAVGEAIGLAHPPPMPDVAEPELPLPYDEADLPEEMLKLAQRKGYLDLADIKRFLPN